MRLAVGDGCIPGINAGEPVRAERRGAAFSGTVTGAAMSEAIRRTQRRLMGGWHRVPAISLSAILLALVTGCTTSSHRQAVQFEPAPRDKVGAQELRPVDGLNRSQGAYSPLVLPNPLPEPVLAEIRELQNDYPGTFQRGLNRASKYEGPLRARLCEAGLPEDLIWLAMVESMFQNKIVSPAGAGGMWQFIPASARRFQLRMDSYVDERYNWQRCTEAAIEYLKNLHDFFDGRWDLAVTAYNMGEGGLARAIAANGGETDFFKLIQTPPASDRIRMESKKYYPRLLAYIVVTANPEKYGFTRGTEPPDDVERVPVQGMYGLARLDEALGFAPGTLEQLNPDLLRDTTPPSGEYRVAVPKQDRDRFLAALQTVPTSQPAPTPTVMASGKYKVRKGESLATIAKNFGTTEKALLAANRLKTAKAVRTGQTLTIPGVSDAKGGAETPAPAPAAQSAKTAKQDNAPAAAPAANETPSAAKTYKVRKGDTLAKIAAANNVPMAQLVAWNKIGKKGGVVEGQVLTVAPAAAPTEKPVPAAKPAAAADQDAMRYHQVAPGEYPAAIAKLYGLKTDELLRMNGKSKDAPVIVGEKLMVGAKPGGKSAEPPRTEVAAKDQKKSNDAPAKEKPGKPDQKPITVSYKVARGENIAGIAAKHGVKPEELMAWNKLSAKSVIKEGQELTVRKPAADSGRDTGGDVKVAKAAPDAKGSKVVHTVAPGQSPSGIAKQYGVDISQIYEWNAWPKNRVLQVGDAVVIYKKKP
jgi:membrane-bound lytic murein transglycosylase D